MQRFDELEMGGGQGRMGANQQAVLQRLAGQTATPLAPGAGDSFNPAQRSPNTGIGGPPAAPDLSPLTRMAGQVTTPKEKPSFSQWGQYMPQGVDMAKVQGGVDDPKYQIGRVLSNFDPRQGITPEAVAALNALGIGNFRSDARDKLYVDGNMDPRFKDVVSSDVINNFGADGATWNGWGGTSVDPQPQGGGIQQAIPQMGQGLSQMNPLLQGNSLAAIQAALGQYGGESSNLKALLAQLGQ